MTFLELQDYVGRNCDDKAFGYFTLTDVKARLNLAQREVQKRLISANNEYYTACVKTNTVAYQRAYSLPSDFLQVIRLERVVQASLTNPIVQKIQPITPNQRQNLTDVTGDPDFYYFQKNYIMLVPTPNRVQEIHLEYSYQVTDMVNDNDVPDAPEWTHEYIGVLATRDCLFQDERSMQPIQKKLDDFEKLMKEIAVQRNADDSRMVTVTDSAYGVY